MMRAMVLENAAVVQSDGMEIRDLVFVEGYLADERPAGAIRVDASAYFVYPGLINAHDHLQLNGIPRLVHDGTFADSYAWIDSFAEHLQEPHVAAAVQQPAEHRHWQGGLKNVLAGVTCAAHHDPMHVAHADVGYPVHVPTSLGWSHSLRLGTRNANGATRYGPDVRESFLATPANEPWIIHLAEGTSDEAQEELAVLDALGCLASNTVVVHGVGLSARDIDRIIALGASVVWCPSSNLELFGETLSPDRLARTGRLALGTDSRLTGARDLLDELRVAAASSTLSPRELMTLVTSGAARVLRLSDAGFLRTGARADCMLLARDGDPYEALLGAARADVCGVVRDGALCVGDAELATAFGSSDTAFAPVRVDGRPKVMARSLLRPAATSLEPGLEVC